MNLVKNKVKFTDDDIYFISPHERSKERKVNPLGTELQKL